MNKKPVYDPTSTYEVIGKDELLCQILRDQLPVCKIQQDAHSCKIIMSGGYLVEFWCSNLWYAFASKGRIKNLSTGLVKDWDNEVLPESEFMMLARYFLDIPLQPVPKDYHPILEGHQCKTCGGEESFRKIDGYNGQTLVFCTKCAKNGNYIFCKYFKFLDKYTVELKHE